MFTNICKKFVYLMFFPLLILIRIISKFYLIRFGELVSDRIGHFACCTELYLCEKDHNINVPKKKFLDLFIMGKIISNKQIEVFIRRKLIVLPRFILGPLININKIIPGGEEHDFFYRKTLVEKRNFFMHRDTKNLLDISKNHFEFTKKENYEAIKKCYQIGINLNKKIVIVHSRDNFYLNKYQPNKNFDYHNVRNFDINDFKLAIEELIQCNYQVIRIGKGSANKLEIDNSYYFDLSNHKMRTDLLEVFLMQKSSFIIGCNSGATMAASYLFKKPTYISNFTPIGLAYTNSKKTLINFKSIVCSKTNKQLSLTEICERGFSFYQHTEKYEKENLMFQNLDPVIIKKSVNELMLRSENKWIETKEEQRLKNKFLEVYNNILKKNKEIDHGKINCNFGYYYLKTNEEFLR